MAKDDSPPVTIEMATTQDAAHLFEAVAEGKEDLLLVYPLGLVDKGGLPKSEDDLRRSVANGSGGWVIAKHGEEIVGWTLFSKQWGGVGIVAWGWVKRELRRRGIASELTARSLLELKAMQCHKAITYVGVENTGAVDLCTKLGFREEGTLRNHFYGADLILLGMLLSRLPEGESAHSHADSGGGVS